MQEQVLQFIFDKNLFLKDDKLLVAVSGGVDSIALADMLSRCGYSVAIAHCNFQLRGEESDGDEALVAQFAQSRKLKYHVQRFNTRAFSSGLKLSTQEAARELRYAWFNELVEVHSYNYVLTAHHIQDLSETILINQIRGTGLKGLIGIPLKNSLVVRPLLNIHKKEILQYAKLHKLKWREDSSNSSDVYTRNKLRNKVFPILREIEPQIDEVFAKNAVKAKESFDLLNHFVEDVVEELVENEGVEGDFRIPISKLKTYPHPHLLLYHILNNIHFNYAQCVQISNMLDSESGKMVQNEEYGVWKDRDFLLVHRVDNIPFNIQIPGIGTYEFPYGILDVELAKETSINFKNTPKHQCLVDADKIEFPLTIRNWEKADKFQPLGMKGTKLVSDFFVDLKLPVFRKKQVPIVLSNNQIVWVGGLRPDHRFKVEEDSEKVIRLSFT